ncbi:MAG: NAD(P)H-dependent oxidoreductase [Gammaproteobacteria bacterium]|nr:NAD(P)H-dependent oxidoreductase [Gammaproteobacteria bacterium]
MNILMFAASLRKDSVNKKLIHIAADLARAAKHRVTLEDFSKFNCVLYDGDVEEKTGLPVGALKFVKALVDNDVLIMASPEYNYSTPGTVKNLIDWASRAKPIPWKNKPILLLSASPAMAGGHRGLLQTTISLACCGAYVYPNTFSLSNAYEMFDEQGQLKESKLRDTLEKRIEEFLRFSEKILS